MMLRTLNLLGKQSFRGLTMTPSASFATKDGKEGKEVKEGKDTKETKETATKGGKQKVVIFPGDGIGPEISQAVMDIFTAAKVPVDWEHHQIHSKSVTAEGDLISQESIDAVLKHKVGLKGPFETPIGKGHRSLNVTLRKKLQLYANVRPVKSIPGVKTAYTNVDLVTIRENTEGEYSGLEHEVVPGVVENLKIISRQACENVSRYAFEFARKYNRKRVTACHKATVMRLGDGLFLNVCREVAKNYPEITFAEKNVDTACMKLASHPEEIDVMVMPNLYGDIISDLCAGLIGGLGLTPSGNIGKDCAIFEAVHGSAPDIAGKNLANPSALLFSSTMMLTYMNLGDYATRISDAATKTFEEGKHVTRDIGGKATTTEFVKAVIGNMK